MTPEHARLRAWALEVIAEPWNWTCTDAQPDKVLLALSGYSNDRWVEWQTVTGAREAQWFVWLDPTGKDGPDMHLDRVMVDGAGRIAGKEACGLLHYPLCQPCVFAEDVKQALIAAGQWEEN